MSRILIIEDEPAIRRVLVKILSEEDRSHEIDEAENGIDAINHIKKNSYDLIISDIMDFAKAANNPYGTVTSTAQTIATGANTIVVTGLSQNPVVGDIFLVNGIKLQGTVDSFDQFVVMLKSTVSQMVYKHAISTIVPARSINYMSSNAPSAQTSYNGDSI